MGPEAYGGIKAKLESIEKILGINAEHKSFPYSRVKEYITKQIPKIGEKVHFLEKTLGLNEEEAKKDFAYPQVKLVTKKIPKIGEKLDFLETVLGLTHLRPSG